MKILSKIYFWLFTIAVLMYSEAALAGPGGKIASAMFTTFWGKLLLIAVVIVFLPFIIYSYYQERAASRRTQNDLRVLAQQAEPA